MRRLVLVSTLRLSSADKVTVRTRAAGKNQKTASSGNRLAKVNTPLPTSLKKIVVLKSPCICVKAKQVPR
ncbi:hypothetical protein ACNKHM_04635 [Shigella sonnei]